jgi:hypothetical protein
MTKKKKNGIAKDACFARRQMVRISEKGKKKKQSQQFYLWHPRNSRHADGSMDRSMDGRTDGKCDGFLFCFISFRFGLVRFPRSGTISISFMLSSLFFFISFFSSLSI